MSSKFSGHGKLHKPPAVCKAPPAASLLPPKPHHAQTFQGYATWQYGDDTDHEAITVPLEMIPLGNGTQWEGISAGAKIQLKLLMTWLPPEPEHRYHLTRLELGRPVETTTIEKAVDRQFHPFDSGLLLFPSPIPYLTASARLNF